MYSPAIAPSVRWWGSEQGRPYDILGEDDPRRCMFILFEDGAVWYAVLPYQRALAGSMAGLNVVDGLRPSSCSNDEIRQENSRTGGVGETDDV